MTKSMREWGLVVMATMWLLMGLSCVCAGPVQALVAPTDQKYWQDFEIPNGQLIEPIDTNQPPLDFTVDSHGKIHDDRSILLPNIRQAAAQVGYLAEDGKVVTIKRTAGKDLLFGVSIYMEPISPDCVEAGISFLIEYGNYDDSDPNHPVWIWGGRFLWAPFWHDQHNPPAADPNNDFYSHWAAQDGLRWWHGNSVQETRDLTAQHYDKICRQVLDLNTYAPPQVGNWNAVRIAVGHQNVANNFWFDDVIVAQAAGADIDLVSKALVMDTINRLKFGRVGCSDLIEIGDNHPGRDGAWGILDVFDDYSGLPGSDAFEYPLPHSVSDDSSVNIIPATCNVPLVLGMDLNLNGIPDCFEDFDNDGEADAFEDYSDPDLLPDVFETNLNGNNQPDPFESFIEDSDCKGQQICRGVPGTCMQVIDLFGGGLDPSGKCKNDMFFWQPDAFRDFNGLRGAIGRGVPDAFEDFNGTWLTPGSPGYGVPDAYEDFNGNGAPDAFEYFKRTEAESCPQCCGFNYHKPSGFWDMNGDTIPPNKIPNAFEDLDHDGSWIPDAFDDLDRDGKWIPDIYEDLNHDGFYVSDAWQDYNCNNVPDVFEDFNGDPNTNPLWIPDALEDNNHDGMPDAFQDWNHDQPYEMPEAFEDWNDNKLPDAFEDWYGPHTEQYNPIIMTPKNHRHKPDLFEDFNGDGKSDALQSYSGNPTIPDGFEDFNQNGVPDAFQDWNGDKLPAPDFFTHWNVADATNAGILDSWTGVAEALKDWNGNGAPDGFENWNGDPRGIPDVLEDFNRNGKPDAFENWDHRRTGPRLLLPGSDTRIPDAFEVYVREADCKDGDCRPEGFRDLDGDGKAVPDMFEVFTPDRDLRPDAFRDSNRNGVPDAFENWFDNNPNFRNMPDAVEDWNRNGVPECFEDWNSNTLPDAFEDWNSTGGPDAYEDWNNDPEHKPDCFENWDDHKTPDIVPDAFEDWNGNDIPDCFENLQGGASIIPSAFRDLDRDGKKVPDCFEDLDADQKLIPDAFEDWNLDGKPDVFEEWITRGRVEAFLVDINSNGIPDTFEDFDGDSFPAAFNIDVIQDGTPDFFEDWNSNNKPDCYEDWNGNGIPDCFEDWKRDGKPDVLGDFDHDGQPDAFQDWDYNRTGHVLQNGVPIPDAFEDLDDDQLTAPDAFEDWNGNGIPDCFEDWNLDVPYNNPDAFEDWNGNGAPDAFENWDHNRTPNNTPDAFENFNNDLDGTPDAFEDLNNNGGIIPDAFKDYNGDKIPEAFTNWVNQCPPIGACSIAYRYCPDAFENWNNNVTPDGFEDFNDNQIPDVFEDFPRNGATNGIPDAFEDFNRDGIADAFRDVNGDKTPDCYEDWMNAGKPCVFQDYNQNNIPDAFEDWTTKNGPDAYEDWNNNGKPDAFEDWNGNGNPDAFEDLDHDTNWIPDAFEDLNRDGKITPDAFTDWDADGVPDPFEDWNGNGRPDAFEYFTSGSVPDAFDDLNADTSTVPDCFDDLDNDHNNMPDAFEDWNGNKIPDTFEDFNGNGIPDAFEFRDNNGPRWRDIAFVDWNGDGKRDYYADLNHDGKQMPDCFTDWNNDKVPEAFTDWNGNGKPDVMEDWNHDPLLMPDGLEDWNHDSLAVPDTFEDWNGNGVPDAFEDWNHNLVPEAFENWNYNVSVPDAYEDLDGDGQLMPDAFESWTGSATPEAFKDWNGNIAPDCFEDWNHNGIPEAFENWNDRRAANSIPDAFEDFNGNREPDAFEDWNANLKPDCYEDLNRDGKVCPDAFADVNLDGYAVPDMFRNWDHHRSANNIPDALEDFNHNNKPDAFEDFSGNGIPDVLEDLNTDQKADGFEDFNAQYDTTHTPDAFENWDDHRAANEIPDAFEDFDLDGKADAMEDYDGNLLPDGFQDLDNDGDTVPEAFEDWDEDPLHIPDAFQNWNGNNVPEAFKDCNGNGVPDAFEDFSGDHRADGFTDFNHDARHIPDAFEHFNMPGDRAPDAFVDWDTDKCPDAFEDYLRGCDTAPRSTAFGDYNKNGIPEIFEVAPGQTKPYCFTLHPGSPPDGEPVLFQRQGFPLTIDVGGDCIPDTLTVWNNRGPEECKECTANPPNPSLLTAASVPGSLVPDCFRDWNGNGFADAFEDFNWDGFPDAFEDFEIEPRGVPIAFRDFDNDANHRPDFFEDWDRDWVPEGFVDMDCPPDTVPEAFEDNNDFLGADGGPDGIPDGWQKFNGSPNLYIWDLDLDGVMANNIVGDKYDRHPTKAVWVDIADRICSHPDSRYWFNNNNLVCRLGVDNVQSNFYRQINYMLSQSPCQDYCNLSDYPGACKGYILPTTQETSSRYTGYLPNECLKNLPIDQIYYLHITPVLRRNNVRECMRSTHFMFRVAGELPDPFPAPPNALTFDVQSHPSTPYCFNYSRDVSFVWNSWNTHYNNSFKAFHYVIDHWDYTNPVPDSANTVTIPGETPEIHINMLANQLSPSGNGIFWLHLISEDKSPLDRGKLSATRHVRINVGDPLDFDEDGTDPDALDVPWKGDNCDVQIAPNTPSPWDDTDDDNDGVPDRVEDPEWNAQCLAGSGCDYGLTRTNCPPCSDASNPDSNFDGISDGPTVPAWAFGWMTPGPTLTPLPSSTATVCRDSYGSTCTYTPSKTATKTGTPTPTFTGTATATPTQVCGSLPNIAGGCTNLSFPMQLLDPMGELEARIGGLDCQRHTWELFRFNPSTGCYVEACPNLCGTLPKIEPGLGFILCTSYPIGQQPLCGPTSNGPVSVNLVPGWNQVAVPFGISIPALSCSVAEDGKPPVPIQSAIGSLVDNRITYFNGLTFENRSIWEQIVVCCMPPHTFAPWDAAFVCAFKPCRLIFPDPSTVYGSSARAAAAAAGQQDICAVMELNLEGSSGYSDTGNLAVIAYSALDGHDVYDAVAPPPPIGGQALQLSFPHTDWGAYAYKYENDARPPNFSNGEIVWTFEVSAGQTVQGVQLSWAPKSGVWTGLPADAVVTVRDLQSNAVVPNGSQLTVTTSPRQFELRIQAQIPTPAPTPTVIPTSKPGDLTQDGVVDHSDVFQFGLKYWTTPTPGPSGFDSADLSQDGTINAWDIIEFLQKRR